MTAPEAVDPIQAAERALGDVRIAFDALRANVATALEAKAAVEPRTCAECTKLYAELVGAASTLCPSCRFLGAQAGDSGLTVDRSLRHDTPKEVAISAICHEAMRAFAQLHGKPTVPPWSDAPGWLVASTTELVRELISGAVTTAEALHESWSAARVRDGWTYHPTFNPIERRHPNLVPWSQLTDAARTEYRLFVAMAVVLLSS